MPWKVLKKLRRDGLLIGLLALLLCVFGLSLAALSLPDWVSLGHDDFLIEGGLVRCHHCPGDLENRWYREIASSNYCSPTNPSMTGLCKLISDLNTAGLLFLVSELTAVLALVGWVTLATIRLAGGRPNKWFLFGLAGSATFLHVIGVFMWMGVSEATYDDCSDLRFNGSRPNVCITVGPTLALVCVCLYAVCIALLVMILYKKKGELHADEVPSTTMRFTFGNITEMSESKA